MPSPGPAQTGPEGWHMEGEGAFQGRERKDKKVRLRMRIKALTGNGIQMSLSSSLLNVSGGWSKAEERATKSLRGFSPQGSRNWPTGCKGRRTP